MLKKTKSYFIILGLLIAFVAAAGSVYAAMDAQSLYLVRDHILNTDGYLTEDELDQLESRIVEMKEKYGMEHVLVVNFKSDWGYYVPDKEKFADNIFIDNNFGAGNRKSGSILLIDFYPPPGDRDIIIRTRGDLINPFQPEVKSTIDGLASRLKDRELFAALNYYLDRQLQVHKKMGEIDEKGNYIKPPFISRLINQLADLQNAGIAAVIALVICIFPLFSYKGAKTVSSRTYEVVGSFNLTTNTDVYSHSHTTSVYDPPSSSSSSSSGGGGGSSGGGSGKF